MKSIAAVLLGLLLAGSLAACGSSMHTSTTNSTANAQAQIRSAYEQLFSPQTSLADRVAVLQDGSKFKTVIAGFASNPLAKKVTVDVSKVQLQGADQAKVDLHRQVRRDVASYPDGLGRSAERRMEGGIREPLQARRAERQHAVRLQVVTSAS